MISITAVDIEFNCLILNLLSVNGCMSDAYLPIRIENYSGAGDKAFHPDSIYYHILIAGWQFLPRNSFSMEENSNFCPGRNRFLPVSSAFSEETYAFQPSGKKRYLMR